MRVSTATGDLTRTVGIACFAVKAGLAKGFEAVVAKYAGVKVKLDEKIIVDVCLQVHFKVLAKDLSLASIIAKTRQAKQFK